MLIAIVIVAALILFVFGACRVAGRADDRSQGFTDDIIGGEGIADHFGGSL